MIKLKNKKGQGFSTVEWVVAIFILLLISVIFFVYVFLAAIGKGSYGYDYGYGQGSLIVSKNFISQLEISSSSQISGVKMMRAEDFSALYHKFADNPAAMKGKLSGKCYMFKLFLDGSEEESYVDQGFERILTSKGKTVYLVTDSGKLASMLFYGGENCYE